MYSCWNIVPSYPIKNTSFHIIGYSISTVRTAFYIDGLRLMLDAGLPYKHFPKIVLITHGHSDHYYEIAHRLEDIPIVLCPDEMKSDLCEFIDINCKLNKMDPISSSLNIIGMKENQEYPYQNHIIETFKCYHTIPTIGYGIYHQTRKLKREFENKSRQALVALKKEGIEITEMKTRKLICYLCDTTTQVFANEKIFEYSNIFIECTFIDDDTINRAEERGHVHWSKLKTIILEHPENMFILFHFSKMYTIEYIKNFFTEHQLSIPNMKIWI